MLNGVQSRNSVKAIDFPHGNAHLVAADWNLTYRDRDDGSARFTCRVFDGQRPVLVEHRSISGACLSLVTGRNCRIKHGIFRQKQVSPVLILFAGDG
jgi:hypothetical protein